LEEYLLTHLPDELWGKINYNEKEAQLFSTDKEIVRKVKKFIASEQLKVVIVEEKTFWEPLIPCQLTTEAELNYYQELKKHLFDIKYYTNCKK
jgi:hypothetical protein